MAHVMKLADDSIQTVFGMDDFLELVDKHMGYEARVFIEEWKSDVEEDRAADVYDRMEAEKELEQVKDHQHSLLCNIREEIEAVDEMLLEDRLNRKKLQIAVKCIWQMINREL